ncbi:MAG: phenylalanine--tRNA ligase subunit beta [Deltaproteobacteria bacterium]|jgi:phenylalanyl-tRNA synthetase beta chain|nr:phenylalanine--tRNA ligase subunit beta [Deltaproteobacteria bacterium]
MLASLSWLGEFVDIFDLSPEEVADRLIMVGLEVEKIINFKAYLDEVRAAKLVKAEERGRLTLATLDVGEKDTVEVICGAKNLKLHHIYPLVMADTKLPSGIVKTMNFGGIISSGMLTSAWELLVGEDQTGILELAPDVRPGTPLSQLYEACDWIFEVGVTPNRGDALCHLGIARDLGAILNRPLKNRFFPVAEEGRAASEQIQVEVEFTEGCFRYCGRVINGAKPAPSPLWLASRLYSLGLRSINNIVDVTNYVMLELGLPLHAFDLKKIKDQKIIVRAVDAGTKFTTLDGVEREFLIDNNVMICDGAGPVGIGGVMGGLNSEVTAETQDIFLEGAMFNPVNIRRTSKSLGLSTDASFRFERGQDINRPPQAVDRAASLISSLTYAHVAPGLIDTYPKPYKGRVIWFSPGRCNALLGTSHSENAMFRVLSDVGISFKEGANTKGEFPASIPSWRLDISREADLFEEVVRLLDFENLPVTLPKPPRAASPPPRDYTLKERLRTFMVGRGFCELMSYSFLNRNFADKLTLSETHPLRQEIRALINPLSEEQGVLRTCLVPALLNAARLNQYHNEWELRLFEVGSVFRQQDLLGPPKEISSFGALLTGSPLNYLWNEEKREIDFFDLKGVLESLAGSFKEVWEVRRESDLPPFLDNREAGWIYRGGEKIGFIGLINERVASNFGLKKYRVYLFEIETSNLPANPEFSFFSFSSYPAVYRDLAVLVDINLPAQEILNAIWEDKSYPLTSLSIFDVYTGEKLPQGKKSVAFRLFFQDNLRTLTEEIVSGYFKTILESLEKRFQATLRS